VVYVRAAVMAAVRRTRLLIWPPVLLFHFCDSGWPIAGRHAAATSRPPFCAVLAPHTATEQQSCDPRHCAFAPCNRGRTLRLFIYSIVSLFPSALATQSRQTSLVRPGQWNNASKDPSLRSARDIPGQRASPHPPLAVSPP